MIERIGYALPVLPWPPANMPWWAATQAKSSQAIMDNQYLHGPGGLDNFYDQAESYLTTQDMKRNGSVNPSGYIADAFKMTIPRREIVAFDENGNQLSNQFAPADPAIKLPVLPPYVPPPVVPSGFKVLPAVTNDQLGQMMAAIMAKLQEQDKKLDMLFQLYNRL